MKDKESRGAWARRKIKVTHCIKRGTLKSEERRERGKGTPRA